MWLAVCGVENPTIVSSLLAPLSPFDRSATTMGDGSHRCAPNPLDRMEGKCRPDIGSRSPVQSSTDTPGTSASTPTSSSEDGHDKLLGVDPDYCRRILVRGKWAAALSN
ncbi:Ventral anterior homeobox 2 [Xenoophorus captivus]|uniref:Ventral anterior homeobox 2 n=1 Tax=Xenoophorus captivus TaxID=1517983 RepID=A0ABV0R5Z3_9TELE